MQLGAKGLCYNRNVFEIAIWASAIFKLQETQYLSHEIWEIFILIKTGGFA